LVDGRSKTNTSIITLFPFFFLSSSFFLFFYLFLSLFLSFFLFLLLLLFFFLFVKLIPSYISPDIL
jgi:hypothetical protein